MRLRLALCLPALLAACDTGAPPAPKYYQRVIQPILSANCTRNQAPCHMDDGSGNALGNLDVTSYERIIKRRDVLTTYGSYPLPLLLIKASGTEIPPIPYEARTDQVEVFLPSEIEHAGGAAIPVQSSAFFELQKWLANGASEDGAPTERKQQTGSGACNDAFASARPDLAARISTVDVNSPAFQTFASEVEPILTQSCAFATCHSSSQSDFFITCKGSGSDDATKFNFLAAQAFVSTPADNSQIVLRPLAPSAGGVSHTGGVFYADRNDGAWKQLYDWAVLAGQGTSTQALDDGRRFFQDEVMPVLLKRGCALEGCHSPGAANDFKLRAGSQGFFAAYTLDQNYRTAREFLAPEVPDARQSRILKKPVVSIAEGGYGLIHRGGPPLQSPEDPADPSLCPQPWSASSTPFCTLVEWHHRERAALITAGQADALAQGSFADLIAVVRPPDADRLIDFDTYRAGADLVASSVALGALGAIDPASASAATSLLDNCPGTVGTRDVRGPDVAYDGSKVAFAMRTSAADTLDIYEVTLDAAHTCTKVTDGNGMSRNGILLHNLDPMYAPDGSLVFVSTRGKAATGPTRSLKFGTPQTDLWRVLRVPAGYSAPEQMTALLGSELSPAMMANGQVTFSAEKATPEFYQVSGRRMNWDLTDYHPLLAQRAESRALDGNTYPSVGYAQATEVREGLDRDFIFVLSDVGAKGGAGALALFNRSIGPFESDRNDITFLRSMQIIDSAATGRAGATQGAYRSPIDLPDGRILASYSNVTDLAAATSLKFDLVVVDVRTGARTPVANLSQLASQSVVEGVLAYKRSPRHLFYNFKQLVFGGEVDASSPTVAEVHFPDLPMLSTLLGANLRTGRFVDALRSAVEVVVYENQAPADMNDWMSGRTGSQMVFSKRRELGRAQLAADGSAHVRLPALTPLLYDLVDASGSIVFSMTEEDQLGPGERITRGVPQKFFNSACGGCHGSVSGIELDVAVTPDALTGASVSVSRERSTIQSLTP